MFYRLNVIVQYEWTECQKTKPIFYIWVAMGYNLANQTVYPIGELSKLLKILTLFCKSRKCHSPLTVLKKGVIIHFNILNIHFFKKATRFYYFPKKLLRYNFFFYIMIPQDLNLNSHVLSILSMFYQDTVTHNLYLLKYH